MKYLCIAVVDSNFATATKNFSTLNYLKNENIQIQNFLKQQNVFFYTLFISNKLELMIDRTKLEAAHI